MEKYQNLSFVTLEVSVVLIKVINNLLMNESEYLMKNYGDRGGCYLLRP